MILNLKNSNHVNLLDKLESEYNNRLSTYRDMANYYEGKTKAKKEYTVTDRSNRKASINYIKKFINEETSFAVGNSVSYVSEDSNKIKDITRIINKQKSVLDTELVNTLGEFGTAYELRYLYNGELKIKIISPLYGIAYCNEQGQAELFMYFYYKELDDDVYMDVIDDKFIYKFKGKNKYNPLEVIPHYFNTVPVGVAKFMNEYKDTIYWDIHELQDIYEMTIWDSCNNIADLRSSYLVLSGISIDDDDAKKMKSMGILQLPDANGKAEWLTKNLESDFCNSLTTKLEDLIYQISAHINHNVVMASNTSGVALSSRLISLRNKVTVLQKSIQDCMESRLKDICTYCNLTNNSNYDYSDIDIIFTMNLPQDDVSMAQIISQLSGKLPIETGLNQLSFVNNGSNEFNKMLEEQKMIDNNLSSINLDKEVDIDE